MQAYGMPIKETRGSLRGVALAAVSRPNRRAKKTVMKDNVKGGKLYYRGFSAKVSYDPQDGIYVGIVDGVPDVLGFHADTLEELPLHFRTRIEDYIKIIARYKRGSAADGGQKN